MLLGSWARSRLKRYKTQLYLSLTRRVWCGIWECYLRIFEIASAARLESWSRRDMTPYVRWYPLIPNRALWISEVSKLWLAWAASFSPLNSLVRARSSSLVDSELLNSTVWSSSSLCLLLLVILLFYLPISPLWWGRNSHTLEMKGDMGIAS